MQLVSTGRIIVRNVRIDNGSFVKCGTTNYYSIQFAKARFSKYGPFTESGISSATVLIFGKQLAVQPGIVT